MLVFMSPARKTPTTTAKRGRGRPSLGRVRVFVSMDKQHLAALRAEAFRRAAAADSGRPDVSEVVREALDAWVKRKR